MTQNMETNQATLTQEPTPFRSPNIYERLLRVQAEAAHINKRPAQGLPYKFISHDDVTTELGPLLVKHGVMALPTVIERHWDGNRCSITVQVTFVNIDDPQDTCTIRGVGDGQGNTDKEAGKALSYALKMLLLKAFWIGTGEKDNETEEVPYSPIQAEQIREFLKLLEAGSPIDFYNYVETFNDAQKMALWKEINTKTKARARELLKQAREELA